MNIKKWVWCMHCERCFEAFISSEPLPYDEAKQQYAEEPINFAPDFEMQFGVQDGRRVYAECPYEGCDGSLLDFRWWDERRADHSDAPEVPEPHKAYPLYP